MYNNVIHILLYSFIILLPNVLTAQVVNLLSINGSPDEQTTLVFDASLGNGELIGAEKVYAHHGVVVSDPDGTEWNYVIGNWGQDDGVGQMTKVIGESDKWELVMEPSLREHFGASADENIFRVSVVFRSADGTIKGTTNPGQYPWGEVTSNQDFYLDLSIGNFISLDAPVGNSTQLQEDENLNIKISASSDVSSLSLWLDEGTGYIEVASINNGTDLEFGYEPNTSLYLGIRINGTVNGEELEFEKQHYISIITPTEVASLPAGVTRGINYDDSDPTQLTLVLEAPDKDFIYAVGDFSDWIPLAENQMKKTPDGELWWLTIEGLTQGQSYVYQYWIDGEITVGDPLADQVADPWNDVNIEGDIFPNIPVYNRTDLGLATVFTTGQEEYVWAATEDNWVRPEVDDLVIYELLVRDFVASHSYQDLIDTLDYIKNLGVDAIELMPINEFEGNESWGYNPSYYFAPDKYYGSKNDLKQFVEACHQKGLAVILDMVLNHAFGQCAMVRMYWDDQLNRPAPDNPWFNDIYVGQYQWGYDFNHESDYTKDFIDRVNAYWLQEFHFDGFRFDFTKGFTNFAPGGSVDGFDQSRIDILERMADKIWEEDSDAYIILEHWSPQNEESILGAYGMKMWRNRSYDYVPATIGTNSGNFINSDINTHVSFFNSHDERRIAEHALTEGQFQGPYNIKDPLIMYERVKMAAAFMFLSPGPKMMWQFDELGYDIDINFNGRVGNKPLPWGINGLGYYEDPLRQYIYETYQGILDVRKKIGADKMAVAETNHDTTGPTRRWSYDTENIDLVVLGNFGLTEQTIDPNFSQIGVWYDYFNGENMNVLDVNAPISLKAGEWHIYSTEMLETPQPDVVEVFESPVVITPFPFTKNDEISITFDATKATTLGTEGLVGASKVYMHSGLVFDIETNELENIVGNFIDDGVGEFTEIEENLWEITLTPSDYFEIDSEEEALKLGMYFRDATNENFGYGFRDEMMFFNIESDKPIINVNPAAYQGDEGITIIFNANAGNRELKGEEKVYMHSSVDITNSINPVNSAWGHVVGNWGQDDGIGEMSQIENEEDLWSIELSPSEYFDLQSDEHPYWLAAVFRNADGSAKGTAGPGEYDFGFIADNLDIFVKNELIIGLRNITEPRMLNVYPNPTKGFLRFSDVPGKKDISIINAMGTVVWQKTNTFENEVVIKEVPPGFYFIRVENQEGVFQNTLIKQ